ncbi:IS3 family transposase [Anaerophaga thermohalophila]|uniref:IS3 family transposase n=1 Tax=Anaerophaga thermohalophila TaxID=177400 RepID=UPI000237CAB5|nr:IS3 family transposase [Anaerophaga thermohalophila]
MKEIEGYVKENEHLSIRAQCDLLGITRSNLYYKGKGESEENLKIMRLIDEEYLRYPTHGVLQIQDFLFASGCVENVKRVRRLLRKMNIMAIYPKRNLSKFGAAQYIHPYLLRGLKILRPNQVWAIDITYIPMEKGFMYLTAIIDIYSRYVVGWGVFNNLNAENSLTVLKTVIKKHGKPEIINSDQGSQFICPIWIDFLQDAGIRISMDGKNRAIDNIFIERLWRTVKRDYVYLRPPENGSQLYTGLKNFFYYYNHEKTHQGIQRQIPAQLYKKIA